MAFNITSSPTNAEILASLLGDTTGLSNIQITSNGNPLAVGLFQDSPVNLGSGVVLSTGQATQIAGGNADDRNNVSTVFNSPGTVANGNDAITLEITFDTDVVGRQLFLQYVFGSEEFLDFAGNSFNDRLTFELNGVNLAKLNNGKPVDVNSLTPSSDPTTFSPDYIPNLSNANPAYYQTVLDGYTVPLTIQGDLLPNAKNRLVITIQDIGDSAVDSAVFLSGGSLGVRNPIPTVNVTVEPPSSVNEDGVNSIFYTFTRTGATDRAFSINYQLGGTATFDTDYSLSDTGQSGTIDFLAGSASATLAIAPKIDTLVEGDETITVNLLPASNSAYVVGAAGSATGTILDEDTPLNNISLTVAPQEAIEDLSANLIYTFTRTGPTTESLRVDYNVGGTALNTSDYDAYSVGAPASFQGPVGSITFEAGVSTVSLTIDPRPDFVIEQTETVALTLTSSRFDTQLGGRSRSYNIDTPNDVVGNILDSPPKPPVIQLPVIELSVQPRVVNENGPTNLFYAFFRNGSTALPLTVNYSVGGTATLGTDYTVLGAASFDNTVGTVTFEANSNFAIVEVVPTTDSITELPETVILQLDDSGTGDYIINTPLAVVGTIVDETTPFINLMLEPQVVVEGGTTHLFYDFSRSGSTNDALTVNYNVGGDATFGADYNQTGASSFTSTAGSIVFAAGSGTARLEITPLIDAIGESIESISLTLADSQTYAIGNNDFANGFIQDSPIISTIDVSLNRASVNEGGTDNLSYTFTRIGGIDQLLNVRYQIIGTAINDTDYNTLGTSITDPNDINVRTFDFAPGVSTFTVRVDPTPDTLLEGDETVSLELLPSTGFGYGNTRYISGSSSAVTGVITEANSPLPVIEVTLSPVSVVEGGQNLVYLFTRTGSITQPLTIDYNISGTAAFTTDYNQIGASNFTDTTGSITFAPNAATATLSITSATDAVVEPDETVTLNLVGSSAYMIGSSSGASGTIVDIPPVVVITPPTINLAVNPASVNEDGTANLIYTFSRTGSTGEPLTVRYRVDGTANSSDDYTIGAVLVAATATVTFSIGANTATVFVDPRPDTLLEADETVTLALIPAGSGQYIVGTSAATGTILDQDTALNNISLTLAPNRVSENGLGNLVYTVTRTGPTNELLRVDYEFGGTAVPGVDYISSGTTGTVTFNVGSNTETIIIDPTPDFIEEPDETVALTLVQSRDDIQRGGRSRLYVIDTPNAIVGTIFDPPRVSVAVSPARVNEDGSAGNLVYTFTRTGSTATALNVLYRFDGIATFNTDYTQSGSTNLTANGGTVTFLPNSSTAILTIIPIADVIVEPVEGVDITIIRNPEDLASYTFNSLSTAFGNIVDSPVVAGTSPTVSLAVNRTSVNEDSIENLVYTFTRTGPIDTALIVRYQIDGTAIFNTDYVQTGATDFTATTGTITFAANSNTATLIIDPTADNTTESNETVVVTVLDGTSDPIPYRINDLNTASGTIVDVPVIVVTPPTINLTVNPASASEDAMTNLAYTFTRTGSVQDPLTVTYRVGGTANRLSGAANATSDYVLNTSVAGSIQTVTFSAGSNTATISATPTSDRIIEGNETVELTLVPDGNGQYIIGTTAAVIGTILDQDDNSVSLAVSPSQVAEDGTENLVYTFTRTGSTTEVLEVDYEFGGNAAFGTDYIVPGANSSGTVTLNIGTVNFAAGSNTATVNVDPTSDSIAETNENVTLRLVSSRNDTIFGGRTYNINTPDAIVGTITDAIPVVNLTLEPISISENGQQNLSYVFSRSGLIDQPLTVNYIIDGSALFDIDYNQSGATSFGNTTGSITFAANSAQAILSVSSIADSLVEQNETISLNLIAASNYIVGVNGSATGTIVDIPPVISPTTATIRTSAGDGELVVSIDEFGRFGSASGVGGNAFYDPLGATASNGTTFSSYVALGIIGDGGNTSLRTVLEPTASSNEAFTSINSTTTNSSFITGGLQFQLNQLVQDTRNTEQNRTGGRLDQTYTITNTTSQTIGFELVRYVDGDLFFDNSIIDGGGRIVQDGQEILFETDSGGTGQTDTTFFGITGTGGIIPTTNRFELDVFNTLDLNIQAGSVLRDRIIQGDANSDLFIDPGAEYDVTLGLRNTFSLAPGASNIYTTTTRFGSGEPAQLDITPPVGGIANLTATTVGTNINLAWSATDPSGVKGYDVFVSTNGGNYTPFQTGVTTTSAVFTGVVGNTYAFYALATDNAGNSQVVAGAPIATTQLIETLPPATPPVITLVVDPISIDESATSGITYTFTRTGALGTSLTVNYNVSGTATFRDDYIQTGANNFTVGTGTIEFAANSSTATLTITPIADSVLEANETIDLTLLSGSGYGNSNYIVGTPGTLTGTIVNTGELPFNGLNFIGTNNLDVGTVNNLSNGIFAVNPNNINFVGDEINLLGGADSITVPNRNVTLQPNSPNQTIQIGSVDSNSTSILDLTPTDLAALSNGFSRIIFGRASGTGNININSSVTFRDPVLLQSPNGQLNITASIGLVDDATLDFNVQSLVKSGNSILTINGNTATTFIGNTTINGGVLVLAKSSNTEALRNAPISINSGILQFNNNEQINNAADLTLNGGTFNLNGFNETLDRLQVTNNSTINLGNGSSKLAFGNSSTANWTGILSIENWSNTSGESIRFGNSANGLTPAQLNNIQFVGFGRGANINASGFLTPVGITVVNPTPDRDGVNDDIEDLAANDGDGNFDGIRDSLQENVASILNLGGANVNSIATIVAQAGARISGLRSLATPITTANLTSLANPIEFKIAGLANGASTTIEYLIAKADQNRQYNTYLMFGPTADNPTPHAYEFLYNGQTGAELFDTNGDGLTDKAIVHFVDGLRGDSDLTVNGEIQDPGAPGVANTPVGLSTDANSVVQITGAGTAIASFSLVANQTRQVSEVGFFRIDGANTVRGIAANAAGFARTALQSGQVIFSSLADTLLSTADISRQLQLSAGDRLGFYLVQNGTVDAALQRNDFSNVVFSLDQANPAGKKALEVRTESNGSYRLKWEQGSTEVNDDLILNLQLQNAPLNNQNLVASIQGDRESELLDLSSFTGRDIQVTFTIKREAAFNNTVGFYRVEDAQGTITSITGAKIKPGEAGYQAAVVQNRIAGVDLAVANGQTTSIDAVLRGGAIYAPFLIANANPSSLNGNFSNVYTSYTVGNADTTDHVRLLGDNTFGFEDLVGAGDRDFNDVVLKAVFRNS
jgi:autotransporter-associated beta strand protein